ncbi:hypothetical protein CHLNCDRAFT_137405 [Chlorella variabilis]|uniref:Uncharacterized protein n=1 Tax=Chlorella variabilis TaxID=554065 RepID=E1ZMD0_CHLVA|nr:hypothetical protein CHLNCDRAFT_137405 [Chlorella variabilis]EFN52983.1 hypothetical protein CHLNCDRAFT_137405 [Chlorella variabilis]|eukprot:XP_005845085.1 hypothetical protein CHLNCDRAFT_137405 [Chlorella variabilis]
MRFAILLCLVAGLLAVPAMARRCQDSCDATTCDHPCSCELTELRCPGASGGATGTDCNNPCEFFECVCPPFNVPRGQGGRRLMDAVKEPPESGNCGQFVDTCASDDDCANNEICAPVEHVTSEKTCPKTKECSCNLLAMSSHAYLKQ